MRSLRHSRPSPNETETPQIADPSPSDARSRQKLRREVAEAKRNRWNSERREKRAKEGLKEMEVKVEDIEKSLQVSLDENELLCKRRDELAREKAEMEREVKRLTAKLDAQVRRERQEIKIATTVGQALSTALAAQQTI